MSEPSMTTMRPCPTGSGRRARGARDSGTKRAVSAMAARPTGMLTQNTPRQPTASTRAPPRTGPSATDRANVPPQAPRARARSARSVNVLVMMDIATGLSMDPPIADPVGGRAGQHQQTRQHERVGVHRPLQPGDRGVQLPADGRQCDVDDGGIQADDEQAEAADDQHERDRKSV